MTNPPTGTVTFLFTDIEGSTERWDRHPRQMQAALRRHNEILRSAVEARGGYVFKTVGDAFCAAFDTARQAIEATLAAQRTLLAEPWEASVAPIRVRMALHTGVAEEEHGGDYFGQPVNRVARLLSAGHGGQVLLSAVTYGLVRDVLGHMEEGSELRDLGEHRLKDLRHTEHVYQLVVPDLPAGFPPLRTHGTVTPAPEGSRIPEPEPAGAPEQPPSGGRYRRGALVGAGGMAEVYLARDEVLERDVALKILRRQYADDEEFVERFRREAKNAASLSHPNIVATYDQGRMEDGEYYIVMEYLPGGTLKERIEHDGPLPPEEAMRVALQVARALSVAHERGVIHRDIKPQNVLLGEAGEAKVADFGIARAASAATMTVTGQVLGTAHYVSPEQAMGRQVGPRSDLYSLGIVLYEMLTATVPYDADTPIGIAMSHVNAGLRPPIEVNPRISGELNAIVVRLLAKDPDDRYPDANALADDLERVLRGSPPARSAPPPVPPLHPGPEPTTAELPARGAAVADPSPRAGRLLLLVGAAGIVLLLLVTGGAALAFASFGPDIGDWLAGGGTGESTQYDPPARSGPGTTAGEDTEGTSSPPRDTTVRPEVAELEADVVAAVEGYYEAVDREDWGYTHDNLASQTRGMFDEREWYQKNQWFADSDDLRLRSLDVEIDDLSTSALTADVTANRTFTDGTTIPRQTRFVYEDGSWKHLFVQEELDLFMPDATYEEFVATYEQDTSGGGEEEAVEAAVREHYEAIGRGDFDEAYTYFGPRMRDQTGGQQYWVQGEEESAITGSTVNSIVVEEVSDESATASVDVSFEDKSGTPRFLITWSLIREDAEWKLDEQLSGEQVQ